MKERIEETILPIKPYIEFYAKAFINLILLSAPAWDALNEYVATTAAIAGVVLTAVLIYKGIIDAKGKKLDNKLKAQQIEINDQLIHAKALENKKKEK